MFDDLQIFIYRTDLPQVPDLQCSLHTCYLPWGVSKYTKLNMPKNNSGNNPPHHFQESCSSCRLPYLRKGHLQTLMAKLKNLGIILDIFLSLIPTILTPAPGHLIIHLVLSALPPKYILNSLTSLHFHCDHTIQTISFFTWDME